MLELLALGKGLVADLELGLKISQLNFPANFEVTSAPVLSLNSPQLKMICFFIKPFISFSFN
jgi:hypothetical protein